MKRTLIPVFLLFLTFTFSAQAQTTSSGSQESMMGFGRAVDVAEGNVFVGEPSNPHRPGMVYVYSQTDGKWSHQQLSAAEGAIGNGFGSALNASGSRLLIGAPSTNDDRGAAYIFENADGQWGQVAHIALEDTTESDFGAGVAQQGDLVFIGAPGENDGVGAVYVYRNAGDSWEQQARIANPDTAKGISFGSQLAADGSRLMVGAPQKQGGAVYVYQSSNNSWTLEGTLESSRVDGRARFGSTLALKGDRALVGAPRQSGGSGVVFAFNYDAEAGSWNADGQLVAFDSESRYGFGSSIEFVGSDVWIGAPGAEHRKGALYQFNQNENGSGWAGVRKLGGPERNEGDGFAGTMAVDGNVAVAGLVGADFGAGKAAIMALDNGSWAVQETVLGTSSSVLKPITGNKVRCTDGEASHFECNNVDLLSFLPTEDIGGPRGVRVNDIWGWTDSQTGKEYALVGRMDGVSFVDISNPTDPVYVANLDKPENSNASVWRDIKVYKNHAYVVADNAGEHGVQVVDLTTLRDFEGDPLTLQSVTNYDQIHSAHNIVINEGSGFAYAVGSSGGGKTCGGGLHMINIQDPANPTFEGCFADPSTGRSGTGYSHDAQCVNYHGPDEDHKGSEICIGANETAISIADVTDKENPKALSTASYPDYAYVHQGWLTEDHRYFMQNDELDEITGNVDRTRTLIWDVSDLDDPQFVREFFFNNNSSDHNLYIKGNTMYQSNYVSGLQVLDVSDPENPVKTGSFDTESFGKDEAGFSGTWSNYPYFDSGIVIMTSGQEGLFILKEQPPKEM